MAGFRDSPLGRWLGSMASGTGTTGDARGGGANQRKDAAPLNEPKAPLTPDAQPALTKQRVAQWLADHGYSYFFDMEGDLGGLWSYRLVYFFFSGTEHEILQIRGQWQREASIERLEDMLDLCNEWNADKVWPKAYVRVRDNGRVLLAAEVTTDLEFGVSDDQLGQLLACGLATIGAFFDSLDETFPDPIGQPS